MVDRRLTTALAHAKRKGAHAADARSNHEESISFHLQNGEVYAYDYDPVSSGGLGVRVRIGNGWGFAGYDSESPQWTAERAVANAKVSARMNRRIPPLRFDTNPVAPDEKLVYRTRVRQDPFGMERQEIIDYMSALDRILAAQGVERREVSLSFRRVRTEYADTNDLEFAQEFQTVEASMAIYSQDGGQTIQRSYEADALVAQGGWERLDQWDMVGNAHRIVDEFHQLRSAPACPQMRGSLILHPSVVYLQTHESAGHGFEGDRPLGYEISYAGGSFLKYKDIGKLVFGSPKVNIKANPSYPGGAGSFGRDDEGVPAQEFYLVEKGIMSNFLTSRQVVREAPDLPKALRHSTGAMRAENDNYTPLIRMTNVYVVPGSDGTLEDMVAATENGVLMRTIRSWSIDNWRRNFHFGAEIGWIIENGKLGQAVRMPGYQDETLRFWNAVDMVGSYPMLLGASNCAKGQPIQSIGVGHPSPPIRVRDVNMGFSGGPTTTGHGCVSMRRARGQR